MTYRNLILISTLLLFVHFTVGVVGEKAQLNPLSWEKEAIQVNIPNGKNSAEGWFEFTNSSAVPVVLESVESDCDCMVMQTDLKVYYPGESGVILAIVSLQPEQSLVEKVITVTSRVNEDLTVTTLLRLKATRP